METVEQVKDPDTKLQYVFRIVTEFVCRF